MANLECHLYIPGGGWYNLANPQYDPGNPNFWLDRQNYDINRVDVYEEWTDANEVIHRETTRKRIQGSFTVGFARQSDLWRIVNIIVSGKNADGTNTMGLYINNEDVVAYDVSVYLTARGATKWDLVNGRRWATLTVDVMEK